MARKAHHWALTVAAMIKGHIKCLHSSTSHGQYWSWEHPLSHQCSRSQQCPSGGCSRSRRCHRSCRKQEASAEGASSQQPASPSPIRTRRQMNSPCPVQPKRWISFGDLSSDPGLETFPKAADQSCPADGDYSPSLSSDLNKMAKMLDHTQLMEEDDLPCWPAVSMKP